MVFIVPALPAVASAGFSFSTASFILSGIGTLASAYGAYQQSRAAKQQAEYQAAVARNNAIIAQQNADDIRDRGAREEDEHRRRISQTRGAAVAAQAGNGFLVDDPGSTNVDLLADIAEAGELDILTIRDNTEREARRAIIQGQNFEAEAGLFGLKASSESPLFSAGATLLSGAAKTAGIGKDVDFSKGLFG